MELELHLSVSQQQDGLNIQGTYSSPCLLPNPFQGKKNQKMIVFRG